MTASLHCELQPQFLAGELHRNAPANKRSCQNHFPVHFVAIRHIAQYAERYIYRCRCTLLRANQPNKADHALKAGLPYFVMVQGRNMNDARGTGFGKLRSFLELHAPTFLYGMSKPGVATITQKIITSSEMVTEILLKKQKNDYGQSRRARQCQEPLLLNGWII